MLFGNFGFVAAIYSQHSCMLGRMYSQYLTESILPRSFSQNTCGSLSASKYGACMWSEYESNALTKWISYHETFRRANSYIFDIFDLCFSWRRAQHNSVAILVKRRKDLWNAAAMMTICAPLRGEKWLTGCWQVWQVLRIFQIAKYSISRTCSSSMLMPANCGTSARQGDVSGSL